MRVSGAGGTQGSGAWLITETSDKRRVDLVGLCTQQLALGERFDTRWIDDADELASFVKIESQGFPIYSGCFHANAQVVGMTILEPVR
jgi:hypothetical protein